jgi:hypothetical protein
MSVDEIIDPLDIRRLDESDFIDGSYRSYRGKQLQWIRSRDSESERAAGTRYNATYFDD